MTSKSTLESVIDEKWELVDPNPDIKQLFDTFNSKYFRSKLKNVRICWNTRMVVSAGICRFTPPKDCSIQLSNPLLRFRPRRDLVETLLHEMIHAYLFIADGDKEREEHGPKFISHMKRINLLSGANITVFHDFLEEIAYYKSHWWMCNGKCSNTAPNYGLIMKSVNRKPGPCDAWWKEHLKTCKGSFIKIKEPDKGDQRRTHTSQSNVTGREELQFLHNIQNQKPKRRGTSLSLHESTLFKEKSNKECQVDNYDNKENVLKQKGPRLKKRYSTINISAEPVSNVKFRKRPHSVCEDTEDFSGQSRTSLNPSESITKFTKLDAKALKNSLSSLRIDDFSLSTEDDNVFVNDDGKIVSVENKLKEITTDKTPGSPLCFQTVNLGQSQPFNWDMSPGSSSPWNGTPNGTNGTPCPICRIPYFNDYMAHHIELCLSRFNISKPQLNHNAKPVNDLQ